MDKSNEKVVSFRDMEFGNAKEKNNETGKKLARVVQDLSGNQWQMERMRPGQGVAEGIHLLLNELSGNNFSWNYASVPGDVYTDLYRAGEIDNPVYGRNMGRAKWVQDYEWWYNCGFNLDEDLRGHNLQLCFDGVDYSCDVWLNGKYLGHHEGMMSSFSFDITDSIDQDSAHVGTNLLAVKLDPPPKNQKNFAGMKHNFAGDYLTGVIPFGIWQPVKIIGTKKARINQYTTNCKVDGTNAVVEFDLDMTWYDNKSILQKEIKIELSDGQNNYETVVTVSGEKEQCIKASIEIEDAKLWWPYELGEQNFYQLSIEVIGDGETLDLIEDRLGIREVVLHKNPGFTEEESELPWTFVINGKEMFLRSACWGGQPSFFYGCNSKEKYRFYLEQAKVCNINNLRIFGWHPPETKDFYDLCDELGITVWTNFSFATQVFREDEEYLQKVDKEIRSIVKNRVNHPSLVMWMGGEEVYFSEAHVKSGNKRLMERIGREVKSITSVPYADASPLSSREGIRMGYKTKESSHANVHYYAAGAIFMEDYYPKLDFNIIPELTAASAPNIESLKKFIPENELWPIGPSWGYHAADLHVLQNLNYEVFGDVCMDSLEHFVEATQIAQGTIFQFALEHFRRMKPHVSGVALCHFITNWPIIKWDLIDYYGKKKRSFDYVRKSYQILLPSVKYTKRRWLPGENFEAELWIVNDYHKEFEDVTYQYTITCGDCVMKEENITVNSIASNSAAAYATVAFVVPQEWKDNFTIQVKLLRGKEVIADNEYMLLVASQELAKLEAKKLYDQMHEERNKYGKGYYRYTPEFFFNNKGFEK